MLDRRFVSLNMAILGIVNEPKYGKSEGDQYIVGPSGTGDFEGVAANSIARYDGKNKKWNFFKPTKNTFEVLDLSTGFLLSWDGSEWKPIARGDGSVIFFLDFINEVDKSDNINSNTTEGSKFFATSDKTFWIKSGEEVKEMGLSEGDRYVKYINTLSSTPKLYGKDQFGVFVSEILDGNILFNKTDGCIYVYDERANTFKRNGADVLVTERHTLTAEEVTAKAFNLNNEVATGREDQVILFVNGAMQTTEVDFYAYENMIRWDDYELEKVGVNIGDVCMILYYKA